ncbi:hypothetical protein Avbf_17790 [Armadillidium vulgare]|nr:hypothetical protein Avbf_15809 [Armadillidium vulgare]RXG61195.1 hypothetical protein Avbf_17790 [Armadillidium vulgare]
MLIIDMSF